MEAMCEALDHPERAVPVIHVTGTNGKTSTARIATSVLTATGLSVGTYTSPHLSSVTERMTRAGDPISEESFGAVYGHLRPYLEFVEARLGERLTYFEVLTAMYFLWAAEAPVDVSVVEVGLGGRWDATNVVNAPVSVVTNIALDHTSLLGAEPEDIAREKSGIAKPGAVLVTGERNPALLDVIAREAASAGASVSALDRDFTLSDNRVALGGRYVSLRTSARTYDGMLSSGKHTLRNYLMFKVWPLSRLVQWRWSRPRDQIEGKNLPDARAVKQAVSIPVLCTGGFQTRSVVEAAIERGDCDGVTIGRPLIANPNLVELWRQGHDAPPNPCTYSNKCLINQLENPLGCYDESRFASRDQMVDEILSVYDPPPFR
jgi:hypothetical protein